MKAFGALTLILIALLTMRDPFDPSELYAQIPRGSEEFIEMYPRLRQRYTYLGEGSQMIAFVSEDGQTVLKLFKKSHRSKFKLSRFIRHWTKDQAQSRRKWTHKFHDTCRRYKMAYSELKDLTGLMALHFHETKTPLFVTLKSRKTHRIDLSKYPFILQQKATLAPEYAKEHPEKAREALKNLFRERLARGISDPRQTLSTNYGFVGGKAVQLDVGKIERFEGSCEEEISLICNRVDLWISSKNFR